MNIGLEDEKYIQIHIGKDVENKSRKESIYQVHKKHQENQENQEKNKKKQEEMRRNGKKLEEGEET